MASYAPTGCGYQANAQRRAALTASGGIGAYLGSREMVCTIGLVDEAARSRVVQLINKSNQFNLNQFNLAWHKIDGAVLCYTVSSAAHDAISR